MSAANGTAGGGGGGGVPNEQPLPDAGGERRDQRERPDGPAQQELAPEMAREIIARSTIDIEFRRRLLEDPRAAIREAFGVEVAAGFTLRFIERDPGVDALIVLPDYRGDGAH